MGKLGTYTLIWGILALLGAACQFKVPDLSVYPPCGDGCPPGCFCLAGQVCVPEMEPYDPRCCQAASCPECLTSTDCPNPLCTCQKGVCLTRDGERDPEVCGRPPTQCQADEDCNYGCVCPDDSCVPPVGEPDPGLCVHGFSTCEVDDDCHLGCRCDGGRCWPLDASIPFVYCAPHDDEGNDIQELMCRGPSFTVRNESELAGAITQAANSDHPYGISFNPPSGEIVITKDLPPLTSLTYLDGRLPNGAPVTLRGQGAEVGLTVHGTSVVLHSIKLLGFPKAAVSIKAGSREVHLFRLRIGSPEAPNGHGIEIEPNTRDIYIGRGREIGERHCVGWARLSPIGDCQQLRSYDANVILANNGDGIKASGVSNLLIEGTWVGFDTVGDCELGDAERPEIWNQGTGIHLENVDGAFVGFRYLDQLDLKDETVAKAGCVAVGRNRQGGIFIQGGGNIIMRCTVLGNTPLYSPYHQNLEFGLAINENTSPVSYGSPAKARDLEAVSANLIHVLTTPAIKINNNRAPVWIRGAQIQSFSPIVSNQPLYLIQILGSAAKVDLVHLSFFGFFRQAAVLVATASGVKLTLANSYLQSFADSSVAVINSMGNTDDIDMHHLMKVRLGPWCIGNCPPLSPTDNFLWEEISEGEGWRSPGAVPEAPNCQVVDKGQDMDLDVNGALAGLYTGCCPDLGAWECVSDSCQAVSCNNEECP